MDAAGSDGNGEAGGDRGSSSGGTGVGGSPANHGGRGASGGASSAAAGTAGSITASGGSNQCVSAPAWPLGCDPDLNLTSTCTFEATCREVRCGQPSSEFDENGCERKHCVASDDCAAGERCVAAPLLGDFSCAPAYFEGCSVTDCGCVCNFDPSCLGVSYCLPAGDHPPENDCAISSQTYCAVYEHEAAMLANYLDPSGAGAGDTQAALRACRDKIQVQIDRCARQANGGTSASGGAPNSEAGASNGG